MSVTRVNCDRPNTQCDFYYLQYVKQPVDLPDGRQLNTDSLLVLEGASPLLEPKRYISAYGFTECSILSRSTVHTCMLMGLTLN